MRVVRSKADLHHLRAILQETHEIARENLKTVCQEPNLLMRLKFDRLGCDPFDPSSPQNLAEQIDLHATCLTAIDGLEILMSRHTAESWILKPGHRSTGPDIESQEGEVAAEVFAAVRKSNNEKFVKDLYRIREFTGLHRYLIYRCPNEPESESEIDGVTVISLG